MPEVNLDAFSFPHDDGNDHSQSVSRERHDTGVSMYPQYSNDQINLQHIAVQQPYYVPDFQQQDQQIIQPFTQQQHGIAQHPSFRALNEQQLELINQLNNVAPPPLQPGWQPMNGQPISAHDAPDGNPFAPQQHQQQYQYPLHAGGRVPSASSDGSVSPRGSRVSLPQHGSYSSVESPNSDQATMVQATGPMSSSVKIPQRPKPGRKPIPAEDAADRRRMQNRMAQRSFRDKRQQKLADALKELGERRQEYEQAINQYRRDNQKLREERSNEVQSLQHELKALLQRAESAEQRAEAEKQRADGLEKQLQSAKIDSARNGSLRPSAPMPSQSFASYAQRDVPSPPGEGNEIDFTTYGRSNNYLRNTVTNDSNQMDFAMAESNNDDNCGFCTDDQNCACKQAANKPFEPQVEPSASKTLPGSCDMCQADPARAQACRDMAKSATMAPRPKVTMGPPKYSCSQMIEEFNKFGQRTATISSLFGGALHTYPNSSGPGYSLDDKEASEVLVNLSRRSTEVERRASNASQASNMQ